MKRKEDYYGEGNTMNKEKTAYFALIVFAIVTIMSLFAFGGLYMVNSLSGSTSSVPSNPFEEISENEENGSKETAIVVNNEVTSVLIIGTDYSGYLADTIMVASFDHKSKDITIMSIPRDTFTYFDNNEKAQLATTGWDINQIPTKTKMNSVYSYGNSLGPEFFKEHVEDFLQVEIDYYAIVNTKVFPELVDAIGGIEFDVPQRMYKSDPYQDLLIDLQPGFQHLDGEEAEGLVRFRDYPQGDLKRIEVQQQFMTTVIKKMITKEGLLNDPIALAKVFLKYIETDFTITDAAKYTPYLNDISVDNIETLTMPYESSDELYVYPDFEALEIITKKMFYPDDYVAELKDIKDASIQVLNGSNVNGLASDTQSVLTEDGYNVKNVGNYQGENEERTVIRVRSGYDASELKKYFTNPIVRYDNKMPEYLDVIIVLGLTEKGEYIKSQVTSNN